MHKNINLLKTKSFKHSKSMSRFSRPLNLAKSESVEQGTEQLAETVYVMDSNGCQQPLSSYQCNTVIFGPMNPICRTNEPSDQWTWTQI